MSDGRRPHRLPASLIGEDAPEWIIAWECAACGAVISEYGRQEPDNCPVDWRAEVAS